MNTKEQFKCPICGKKITITPNLYFSKKLICLSCHQTFKNPVYEKYRGRYDEAMKDPATSGYFSLQEHKEHSDWKKAKVCFIVCGIILAIVCLLTWNAPEDRHNSTTELGGITYTIKDVYGAIDEETDDELTHCAVTNDKEGVYLLGFQGRIKLIPQGEKVRVIRRKVGVYQIRVLSSYETYWVPSSALE